MPVATLTTIDHAVMALCLALVVGTGWVLRRGARVPGDGVGAERPVPAWAAGLALLSANLGTLEVVGMGASGAKYGFATTHFYWLGAIPALVLLALVLVPLYHGSRARSIPDYFRRRFDEKTRTVSAAAFAAMTILVAGVSLYVLGKLLALVLGWALATCVLVAAGLGLAYLAIAGARDAVTNDVLQFSLVGFALVPLLVLGVEAIGGWRFLWYRLDQLTVSAMLPRGWYTRTWQGMGDPLTNAMGMEWFGLAMGLGFVLSFGYWCTDYLAPQRAAATGSSLEARRTPLVAALPRLFFPFLLILPGMIALILGAGDGFTAIGGLGQGVIPPKRSAAGAAMVDAAGHTILDFDLATPMLLLHLFPNGMLGLGLIALLASALAGVAGNLTVFAAVCTQELVPGHAGGTGEARQRRGRTRAAVVAGMALAVGTAHAVSAFNNVLDVLQLVFAFVNAPLLAILLAGMLWKRVTGDGAFWGLLAGTAGAALHHGLSLSRGSAVGIKGGYLLPLLRYQSELAQASWTAIAAFVSALVVCLAVSLATRPRGDDELRGLVWSFGPRPADGALAWWRRPAALATMLLLATVALNVAFT